MQSFEHIPNNQSRANVLRSEIESLRLNMIANTPDPRFVEEIQEEIEKRQAELLELETRH